MTLHFLYFLILIVPMKQFAAIRDAPKHLFCRFFYIVKKTFDPPPTFLLNIWYEILGLYEAFVRLLRILHFFNMGLFKKCNIGILGHPL